MDNFSKPIAKPQSARKWKKQQNDIVFQKENTEYTASEFIRLIERAESRSAARKQRKSSFLLRQKKTFTNRKRRSKSVLFPHNQHVVNFDQLKNWIKEYSLETLPFVTPGQRCVARLRDIQRITAKNPDFDHVRGALICDLFTKLSNHPEYEYILGGFKDELLALIYVDYDCEENYSINDFMRLKMLSEELENVHKEQLAHLNIHTGTIGSGNIFSHRSSIKVAHNLSKFYMDNKNEDRRTLRDTIVMGDSYLTKVSFRAWKQYVVGKKEKIQQFSKYFTSFRVDKKRPFLGWYRYVQAQKLVRMRVDMEKAQRVSLVTEHKLHLAQQKFFEETAEKSGLIKELTQQVHLLTEQKSTMDEEDEGLRELNLLWSRNVAGDLVNKIQDKIQRVKLFHRQIIYDPNQLLNVNTTVSEGEVEFNVLTNCEQLDHLLPEAIVLNWANYILLSKESSFGLRMNNFSQDLTDGFVYKHIIESISNGRYSPTIYSSRRDTAREIIRHLRILNVNNDGLIHAGNIVNAHGDINFCMFVRLMYLYPSLQVTIDNKTLSDTLQFLDDTLKRTYKVLRSRKERDPDSINRIRNDVDTALDEVDQTLQTFYDNHSKWMNRVSAVQNYAAQFMVGRMRRKPKIVLDPLEMSAMNRLCDVKFDTIMGLMRRRSAVENINAELMKIKDICTMYQETLFVIFRQYSFLESQDADDSNKEDDMSMSIFEFVKFLQDYELSGGKLTISRMKSIFVESQQPDDASDETMTPSEWIESLIRIASVKYPDIASLSSRFETLVDGPLSSHGNEIDPFREALSQEDVREILHELDPLLRRVFYMCLHQTAVEQKKPMKGKTKRKTSSVACIARVFRNIGVTNSMLTASFIISVAKEMKSIGKELRSKNNDKIYIVYEEFVQLVVAIAQYVYPSPFSNLKTKIAKFVKNDFKINRITA